MQKLTGLLSWIFFIGSFILSGIAFWEKAANVLGYTILREFSPWRLLEFAVVALLFAISLQLREFKERLKS